MIIVDTSTIYAFYDRQDTWNVEVVALFENAQTLIVPASVIPEADYLLGKRLGRMARMAFLEDLIGGVFEVIQISLDLYSSIQHLENRYADLDLGFVDASIITLANSLGCSQIATLDHRHFVPVAREMQFELLPYKK
jgi:uncharacterized protein